MKRFIKILGVISVVAASPATVLAAGDGCPCGADCPCGVDCPCGH